MIEFKGYDRLVNFTDAVVAIAATLLILPVVDAATQVSRNDADTFIRQVMPQLLMFLLSFAVIANFWLEHHRLFRRIDKFDTTLIVLNFVWIVGIVVMPVPTALVVKGNRHDSLAVAFYIGTMLLIAVFQLLMNRHILRRPELEHDHDKAHTRILGDAISAGYLFIAFMVGVLVPQIGLFALFIMFLIPLTVRVVRKAQAGRSQRA
jgi:uncharacterized membrane protein